MNYVKKKLFQKFKYFKMNETIEKCFCLYNICEKKKHENSYDFFFSFEK